MLQPVPVSCLPRWRYTQRGLSLPRPSLREHVAHRHWGECFLGALGGEWYRFCSQGHGGHLPRDRVLSECHLRGVQAVGHEGLFPWAEPALGSPLGPGSTGEVSQEAASRRPHAPWNMEGTSAFPTRSPSVRVGLEARNARKNLQSSVAGSALPCPLLLGSELPRAGRLGGCASFWPCGKMRPRPSSGLPSGPAPDSLLATPLRPPASPDVMTPRKVSLLAFPWLALHVLGFM